MWRGFTFQEFADQCSGNERSPDKGRTMPIHYGSRALHYHTISSPLATQIPHAVGAALALKKKKAGAGGEDDFGRRIAVAFFGDGAASEGDFYAAVNFAATLATPVLFICRNNGWAISTPTSEQYAGDGVAPRACALGVDALRVDGNDALAVRAAVAAMRDRVVRDQRPAFVELMTYRLAHHSTSDDSTKYRHLTEIREQHRFNPVDRMRTFLECRGWWDAQREADARATARTDAREALVNAENAPKPDAIATLFEDVYDKLPPNLKRQKAQLQLHQQNTATSATSKFTTATTAPVKPTAERPH